MTPRHEAPRPLPIADVDRLADEIAEVACHIDAATHRLLTLIRRFDDGSGWYQHGALSCAHWLNWRIGLDLGAARERVRVARALGALPVIDDALRRGAVSYSKVRAMTRVATPGNESTLLEMAKHATASQLERICRGYRRVLAGAEHPPEDLTAEEERRFVSVRETGSGMVRIEAQLLPEEAAVVMRALEAARRRAWRSSDDSRDRSRDVSRVADVSAETPSSHQRATPLQPGAGLARADALVVVAEAYLSGASDTDAESQQASAAAPVELVVHVDAATLLGNERDHARDDDRAEPTTTGATLDDGTAIATATVQRFACDAAILRVATDVAGNSQTIGRRTRRISTTLRRALRLRDAGCRFPGCTNRITDAHHILSWARGGPTDLANLCSLCRRHHRFVHEHGYRIVRSDDGALAFTRADGAIVAGAPQPRPAPDEPEEWYAELRARHAALGLDIDADTAFPRWDGEPPDYDVIVQALVAPG